ncbi:replicative DNA helicase [Temperatibacter marinus]|uniref:Replicative DNA helicase n=1 Tax=Temperatibacter marinus TaxID=1456591 RepID=A0AA52ECS0_9PROT|nr:replicative DNA helicase [Temperatibacter marinus]WND02310.1 replicative DNA helicase [Temperatibacter marinus]
METQITTGQATVDDIKIENDAIADGNISQPAYRQQPHNLEAEQALLGAILVNNEAAQKVQDFLTPDHFYEPVHGRIFDSVLKLMDKNQIADPVKLKPYFDHDEALADVGGASYLVRLAASAATIINAEDYGRTIYDLAIRRHLINIGEEMVLDAYDAPIDEEASEQISSAEKRLFDLAEMGQAESGVVSFSKALRMAVDNVETAFKDPDSLSGVDTGLKSLNEKIGGMHGSDLVILAGRPAMGKTSLATNIGFNAAKKHADDIAAGVNPEDSKGAVVCFFSLEMSSDQLAARILSDRANLHYEKKHSDDYIQSHKMRQGKLTQDQFIAISRAAIELEEVPLFIDDTPGLSIAALRTRCRRLKRQHGLGMIIVDYLQLLRGSAKAGGSENRVQEISEITRGLKGLAKELHVPVIALSQLSRQVESRENKRPMLSDLRESGSIEQDADMVMFVYREEYYKEKDQPSEGSPEHDTWRAEMESLYGKAEIVIGKQRHGPVGNIQVAFDKSVTRFSDLAPEDHLPEMME